ncbi:MAG: Holliday junction resolvase RuvX [Micrococcales bacterium]
MRSGRRIAFDVGQARIGVAISDFHGILASPAEHIKRSEIDAAVEMMAAVAINHDALEIYVGLPINLRGEATESTRDAVAVAKALAGKTDIPVYLIDERMTTSVAAKAMRQAGKSSKEQRAFIDSAAAAVILEQALDAEKRLGSVNTQLAKDYTDA